MLRSRWARRPSSRSIIPAVDLFPDDGDRLFIDGRCVPGLDRREVRLARLIAGATLPAMRLEIIRGRSQRPRRRVEIADAIFEHRLRQELRLADLAMHG